MTGLRNARARGKRLGRPRTVVDAAKVIALRSAGASSREVSEQTGIGVGTACHALQRRSKNLLEIAPRNRLIPRGENRAAGRAWNHFFLEGG